MKPTQDPNYVLACRMQAMVAEILEDKNLPMLARLSAACAKGTLARLSLAILRRE